jgi:hypothetical protein
MQGLTPQDPLRQGLTPQDPLRQDLTLQDLRFCVTPNSARDQGVRGQVLRRCSNARLDPQSLTQIPSMQGLTPNPLSGKIHRWPKGCFVLLTGAG